MGSASFVPRTMPPCRGDISPKAGAHCPEWGAVLRGLEPVKTAENIAARIGAPASTVEGWIKRPGGPSGKWVLRLIAAYGPGLLCRLFGAHAPVWLSHADMIERLNDFEAQAALLRADVAKLAATGRRAGL